MLYIYNSYHIKICRQTHEEIQDKGLLKNLYILISSHFHLKLMTSCMDQLDGILTGENSPFHSRSVGPCNPFTAGFGCTHSELTYV